MRLTREELRQAAYDLEDDTEKLSALYSEKFVPIIKEKDQHSMIENVKYCLDIIYECLTKVFQNTAAKLNIMYEDLPDFKIQDVMKITYQSDGKTTEERVKAYWNENENEEDNARLLRQLDSLLQNEAVVVENVVKENKQPLSATLSIIEGGCSCGDGDCNDWCGIFAPGDEPNGLPPFHPGCNCVHYYVDTDDLDDINDLDLETEEVEPIEIEVEE